MKKLFISVPMKGRTDEAIRNSMEKMHKIAELTFGEELEVLETYIPPEAPDGANPAIWCLGRSIQKLAEADYFIGIGYTDYFHGCRSELSIARDYGIPCTYVDPYECEFLRDAVEIAAGRKEERKNIPTEVVLL